MGTLRDVLTGPANRSNVVADCARLVDEEVASKGGLSGIAIKGAYGIVKAVKPGFVPEVIDHMLEDFAGRLDPIYQDARGQNQPAAAYFSAHPGEVADALLAITDERTQRAKNQTLKSLYAKLRPTGKKHVEAAVPRIGRLVQKYADAAPPPAA